MQKEYGVDPTFELLTASGETDIYIDVRINNRVSRMLGGGGNYMGGQNINLMKETFE